MAWGGLGFDTRAPSSKSIVPDICGNRGVALNHRSPYAAYHPVAALRGVHGAMKTTQDLASRNNVLTTRNAASALR